MMKLHEQIHNRIEVVNASYKHKSNTNKRHWIFVNGDLVWVHLRKETFPSKRKNKLMPRAEGPYKVVGWVNDNAYKVELPSAYGVNATFNVGDISPYLDDDWLTELRTIPFRGGWCEYESQPFAVKVGCWLWPVVNGCEWSQAIAVPSEWTRNPKDELQMKSLEGWLWMPSIGYWMRKCIMRRVTCARCLHGSLCRLSWKVLEACLVYYKYIQNVT